MDGKEESDVVIWRECVSGRESPGQIFLSCLVMACKMIDLEPG